MSIPELPGAVVPRHSDQDLWLRNHVAALCGLEHDRFPGSQPVSFGVKDLERLENQSIYWVCEKSDGIRVLLVILTNLETKEQLVHIVDRHNTYRHLTGIYFPHWEDLKMPLRSTIVDAELVIDVDPQTRRTTRLLCFDCLVADSQNVMDKPLDKRYGRLKEWFFKPFARMMKDHPYMAERLPFDIKVKEANLSYHLEKVFAVDIPALQHGNDGLIYTPVSTPYVPGTDNNILKWKPPSENSIDFKLVLRFPPLRGQPDKPDFNAKPIFALHVWCGGEGKRAVYEPYDVMHVEDDEWEKLKESQEQLDDRIVEVHWDPVGEHWRMMRFRDDKPNGNHRKVVENIIQSIADGVEKDALLSRSNNIKNAWKTRHGQPSQPSQPLSQAAGQLKVPPPFSNPNPYVQHQKPPPAALPPPPPHVDRHYGPLAPSRWSKVSGPAVVFGMNR